MVGGQTDRQTQPDRHTIQSDTHKPSDIQTDSDRHTQTGRQTDIQNTDACKKTETY